jgi:hypothetical protein
VLVFALVVLAASHKVKKARHVDVDFLFVGKAALLVGELALSHGVVDAGELAEVVGEPALVALGAIVLVVEFAADFLGGIGLDDLSLDGVGEKAVEAVLAVAHVEVDAGIVATLNMELSAFGALRSLSSRTFVYRKVLVCAQVLNLVQLVFKPLILHKFLVEHC